MTRSCWISGTAMVDLTPKASTHSGGARSLAATSGMITGRRVSTARRWSGGCEGSDAARLR